MTKQRKATPEQWALTEETSGACLSACILELRARIEVLEAYDRVDANGWGAVRASMHKIRARIEALEGWIHEFSPSAERMLALQDQIRDGALTLADAVKEIGSKTTILPPVERNPECLANWPGCYEGGYNPHCCRFPKPCSCEVRQDAPANSSASLTSSPAGSLVDRIGSAASLEVAAWLVEQAPEPGTVGKLLGQISTPFAMMADILRDEANR